MCIGRHANCRTTTSEEQRTRSFLRLRKHSMSDRRHRRRGKRLPAQCTDHRVQPHSMPTETGEPLLERNIEEVTLSSKVYAKGPTCVRGTKVCNSIVATERLPKKSAGGDVLTEKPPLLKAWASSCRTCTCTCGAFEVEVGTAAAGSAAAEGARTESGGLRVTSGRADIR